MLPAQNTSGNWVKVVQRIPVRIKVERKPGDPELRAGMSVEADDRHRPPPHARRPVLDASAHGLRLPMIRCRTA